MPAVYPGESGGTVAVPKAAPAPAAPAPARTTVRPPVKAPPRMTSVAADPFAAYTGNSRAAVTSIIEQFLSALGWPAGVDALQLEMALLQSGRYTSPELSYNWLFQQVPQKVQQLNPGAEFGLNKDAYIQQINNLRDSWDFFTGGSDIPIDVVRMAIDQGWTQSEMLGFLQRDERWSDPTQMPWLQQGMGYRDVKNQFFQVYGKNPTGSGQLADWWNFKIGAQQVAGSTGASIQVGQGPQRNPASQSEIR